MIIKNLSPSEIIKMIAIVITDELLSPANAVSRDIIPVISNTETDKSITVNGEKISFKA